MARVAAPELSLASKAGARSTGLAKRMIVPLVLLAIWQILASLGLISARLMSSPLAILSSIPGLIFDGTIPYNLAVSLRRAAIGLLLGGGAGLIFGVISGLWRLGEELFDSSFQMLRTLPFIALTSLFIVWFGVGELPKILLVAFGTFFPIYVNVFAGIRNIDAKLIEMARTVNASWWNVTRHIIIPGALPQALVGLRYSIGVSVLALVIAEQINATAGIGYLLQNAKDYVIMNVIFVCLIIYALMGLSADLIVRALERTLLSWRKGFTGQ